MEKKEICQYDHIVDLITGWKKPKSSLKSYTNKRSRIKMRETTNKKTK